MLKEKKLLLYSISGAAVIASAYIYFKSRKMTREQQYSLLFSQLSQQIISLKQLNYFNYQLKYDKLLYLATFEEKNSQMMLEEQISFTDINSILNQGACSKELSGGSYYYECYDCSPAKQENDKVLKGIEMEVPYQVICEECFKAQVHENHRFYRRQLPKKQKSYCQCGIKDLTDRKFFCNKHQGFDKIKQLYEDQIFKQPKLWKGVEMFFVDSFYYYIETVSTVIQQKLDKALDENRYKQKIQGINYFIQLIINKINEILELNSLSIYLISKLLSKPFDKPISFQIKRSSEGKYPQKYIRLISKQKEINQDLTILDCLLLSYEVMNDNTSELFSKLLHSLTIADEKFTSILCEKFFRMIGFIACDQKSQDVWIYKSELPTFIHVINENIFIQSIFDHLLNTLGADIFNPIEYITFYIENQFNQSIQENNHILLLLPDVCFAIFRQVKQIQSLMQRYPKELINIINNLNQALFFKNAMTFQYKFIDIQQFLSHFETLYYSSKFILIEALLTNAQIFVFQAIKLINDEELTNHMMEITCKSFKEHIQKISDLTEKKENRNENFYTLSLNSLTFLPYLVATSEKKIFTKTSIQKFFNNNFNFKCEEEKIKFLQCLRKVLSKFIFFDSGKLQILLFLSKKIYDLGPQYNYYMNHPTAKIYDLYTLVSSIILLADNNCFVTTFNTPPQKIIYLLQHNEWTENNLNLFYTSLQIFQILLDSTPLLNLFSQTLELFFPEECSSENTQIKKVIKANVEEIIVSCIKIHGLEKMNFNDLKVICSQYIIDQNMVKEYYKEVVNQEESKGLIFLQKQQAHKLYTRHFLRVQSQDIQNFLDKITLKNRQQNEKYSFVGSDFSFEKLFPYQQDILKKIFLDEEYVRQIIRSYLNKDKCFFRYTSISLLLFLLLKVLIQKDQSEIFNEQEKIQIEKIGKILPLSELQELIITDNQLSKNDLKIELFMVDEILEMLKKLSQDQNEYKNHSIKI
ncbi:hypothetical protein ABPG74_007708 [Tetrahymena malaccensis]